MRSLSFALFASSITFSSLAQSGPAAPIATAPASAPVAYETATLPEDKAQAWAMLHAASGLGDETLGPLYLRAHYKAYDAYGRPKVDGTLDYVSAGPHTSRMTFTEGATVISRWETSLGFYTVEGQAVTPPYPASLILGQILHPLGTTEADALTPASYGTETFGGVTVSCFTAAAYTRMGATKPSDLKRACTTLHRPLLAFRGGDYNVFFQQPLAFQHKVSAKKILVRDGADPVLDIDVDLLRTPTAEELKSIDPPSAAVFHPAKTQPAPASVTAGPIAKKTAPSYPRAAKERRIQGRVRLGALIGADGHIENLELRHSPDPELASAAEDAVKHWVYVPYLLNGKPVEIDTEIVITFTLGN